MKTIYILTALLLWIPIQSHAQLILSEVSPTNYYQLADENDDYPDWIEIFNVGPSDQNLVGLSLSDNEDLKWTFPDHSLAAGERVLVYASGKNRGGLSQNLINHWETALYEGDQWRLFIGTEQPPADWTHITFDENTWTAAPGGFGYGDDDDATTIPDTTTSFYYRRTFTVSDPTKLDSAILSMDYDDGFIAYLNGIEIARSSNMPDGAADYMTVTETDHEAQMYVGGNPEVFPISKADLSSLLIIGDNVLAIEVHNVVPPSSDLSGRTWLHFGIPTSEVFYGPNPPFFGNVTTTAYHTNFKIGFGETVALYDVAGVLLDTITVGYLLPGHSMMRSDDSGAWCLTDSPTPAEANGSTCLPGYAVKPIIAPSAGFYQNDVTVTISGSSIRYTTDGSEPVQTSTLYTDPFTVSATTVIRAKSFESGRLASPTTSASYFLGVTHELPVLSITASPGDLFNDGSGELAVYDNYNSGIRAPAHLEYFDQDKNLVFSENASIRPVGGYSIAFDQKSMQFAFDEDYGAIDDVHFPLFARDKPGITSYREFRVRNMDDDWNSTRMRDVIANQLTLPTHCAATGYQHMAVFINGEYWGHYGGREVTNEYYVRDNHGADPDEVDQILSSYFAAEDYLVDEGTGDDFYSMSDFIIQNDMTDPTQFAAAQKRIDWENWVDYFTAEMYLGNGDWFSSMYFNNTRLYRAPDVRWRFILFDVTYAQGNGPSTTINILEEALGNPAYPNRYTDMMNSLLENPGFKSYFINRFADLMNEYWTPEKAEGYINENATEIASEINRQSARWGSPDSLQWRDEVHDLKEFHIVRRIYQRNQIEDYFGLNNQVDITLRVEPAEAGVIHINSIIPKTYPWAGIYFDGNPVTITAISNPGYSFDHWEDNLSLDTLSERFTINLTTFADFTAHFTGSAQPTALELSEVNYHSDPTTDAGDWIEITNVADFPIDLSHFKMQDRDWYNAYPIPAGTKLLPGERLVIVEDKDRFTALHPDVVNKAGSTFFKLDNSGDQIRLVDRKGSAVLQATYDNKAPWACTADGFGRTLERKANQPDPELPSSWFDGCMGGSPGAAYKPCEDELIVSEINYHSSDDHETGDWFEIKNQLNIPVDLSGWAIRDDDDEHIYTIPAGITLGAEGYLVLCEDVDAFSALHGGVTQRIGDLDFGLGNGGDLIRLYDADGRIRLSICYDDSTPWNTDADGGGYTLELTDPGFNLNDPTNWFAGCLGGSPGGPYDPDCIPVGVRPIDSAGEVSVFPNPFVQSFRVQFKEEVHGTIRILDVFGKVILQQRINGRNTIVECTTWSTGIYFAVMEINGVSFVEKLTKL